MTHNVHITCETLMDKSKIIQDAVQAGALLLKRGIYRLRTGEVQILDDNDTAERNDRAVELDTAPC